jgi:tetratricopeptide (TPR) repeat protein
MNALLIYFTFTALITNSPFGGYSPISQNDLLPVKQSGEVFLKHSRTNDTLWSNIQLKILNAFVQSKTDQSDKDLVSLEQALLNLYKNNNNSIISYWYSYACYYHSIYFLVVKDNKSSQKILEEGIKQLNKVSLKNSEHYALLALMESFSIQYAPALEIPSISKRVNQNAEKALEADSLNLRAYYVLGSADFYNPVQYGGGKKAESYLKKAVGLNEQSVQNPYLPSWGKNSAYEMLIRLYINRKQFPEAKKFYNDAIGLFPDDYMIRKLGSELINK